VSSLESYSATSNVLAPLATLTLSQVTTGFARSLGEPSARGVPSSACCPGARAQEKNFKSKKLVGAAAHAQTC